MSLASSLLSISDGTLPADFEGLKSQIPVEWIQNALSDQGLATVRRRKLPMGTVMWLIIGMALYRDRSIPGIVRKLNLVEPNKNGKRQGVTDGAIPQARDRVGSKPLAELFQATAEVWTKESARRLDWRGLKVLGMDGTSLSLADSPANRQEFGGPQTLTETAGYPMMRVVALMVLRSHLLCDFRFDHYDTSELELAGRLTENLPEDSLTILDRGYMNQWLMRKIERGNRNRHWLARWRTNRNWTVVKALGDGDDLVEISTSPYMRDKYPDLPEKVTARAIRYQKKGFRPSLLLTSLIDAKSYPAKEVIELYHERWELELGYDEIKTHTLESKESLRSKTPERVRQEVWGLMLAYNLVRREMEQVALKMKVPPRRISFRMSLVLIRDLFVWASTASPGSLPKMVEQMRQEMKHMVLPKRRSERRYPRMVKRRDMKYPHKPGHPLLLLSTVKEP